MTVFCNAKPEQISYLRVMLIIFYAISGLEVTGGKKNMFPINDTSQIQVLANILVNGMEKLPTVYLGMPLGSKHKALEIWDMALLRKLEEVGIVEVTVSLLKRQNNFNQLGFGLLTNIRDATIFHAK